ncbi:hypothetical protein ML462_03770 [Gramella lutea]|uniref:Uncharacterized protein n=1 Tax=Christiangramia lutea TaxID=1607951 RepID=A0A9X2AA48_9FLAO|nr:hypothetical protein [Christiangramia lutea]MCH4822282.1 hypothetical protein [Christiangramia lutea]
MKKISKYLIVFALLLSQLNQAQQLSSQLIDAPGEKAERIYLHYNSSFFLPGETLEYALYNLQGNNLETSNISKVAYVVLFDSDKNVVFKHTLDLESGAAYSDFLIPSSLASGSYKLVGFTRWMSNYEDPGVFMGDIFIINPYLEIEKDRIFAEKDENTRPVTAATDKNPATFDINLNSESAGTREKLSLNLDLSESELKRSNLSISVRKIDSTVMARPMRAVELSKGGSGNFSFRNLPEYRGQSISGRVLNINDELVNKKMNLTFSVPNRPDKFRVYSTDDNGKFNFQISDLIDYSTARLKVVAEDGQTYRISRDSLDMDLTNMDFPKIPLHQLNEEELSERIVHHQIEQYYASVKADSVYNYPIDKVFYGNKATEYVLDEYTRFSTMNETFVEIVNYVSFRNEAGKKVVKISDFQNPNATGGIPLILVDGIAISDHMDVYNLNPNTVESISVLIDKYYYGPAFYQGVLGIRTKNQSFYPSDEGYELELHPVENEKQFYSPEYTSAGEKLSRIPDYRYQLLWNPKIESSNIEFYTSDISGVFEIRVEGFLQGGKPVSISKEFQVSDKL